jgi:predicted hydrocarbon binding protein
VNEASILSSEKKRSSNSEKSSMLLLMSDSFTRMISYLPDTYGAAGTSMLYSMGYENGVFEVQRLRDELKTLELPLSKQQLLERAFTRISSMGWGKTSLERNNELLGKVNVFVHSNPFSGNCENHGTPGCAFLRGFIAGIVAETQEEATEYHSPDCLMIDADCCLLRVKEVRPTNQDQDD